MPPPEGVRLGPLTRVVLENAQWRATSQFPAWQAWADETERLLAFLAAQDRFGVFLPRLQARQRERNAAIAEARTAFYFFRNGFRILRWEPEEVKNRPGDLEIQWRGTEPIFVEVKAPDWEGELTVRERQAGRKEHPKYINAEARAVAPEEAVVYAMSKAVPKCPANRANLLVVDDDLFVSPIEMDEAHLEPLLQNALVKHPALSGVLLLNPVVAGESVIYRHYFVASAHCAHAIPEGVRIGLKSGCGNL